MFKRKPIYIILLVVFSLVLCADILAYGLTAGRSSGRQGMPWSSDGTFNMQGSFGGRMQQNDGSAADTQVQPDSQNAADSAANAENAAEDGGDASASTDQSTMPDMGEMPSFDPSQLPEGFEGFGRMGARSGFASFIAGWWIPIGIVCILADAFCVVMLIRLSKKRSAETGGEEQEDAVFETPKQPQLSSYEKRRRKRRRTIRVGVILAAIVAVVVIGYVVVRSIYVAQLAAQEAASVVSAAAQEAVITTSISGTGTLADASAQEITIPNGVEIEEYLVGNGDKVEAGDAVAAVDKTSVMQTIANVQAAMDLLDERIADASSTSNEKISAAAAGRVKVIYAQDGESVENVMYASGSLMLLSLDGLMAADIETTADLSAGDSVTVTLSDGTELAGRVDKAAGGSVTVTVTDDGTQYGDAVTIKDTDGNVIGQSTLYIHSELKITGYTGTISGVKCNENDKVDAGDTLLTVTNAENNAEYDRLVAQRGEYEEVMAQLFKLYEDGKLFAECAGTISGISEDDEDTQSAAADDTTNDDTAAGETEDADSSETDAESSSQLSFAVEQDLTASRLVYTVEMPDETPAATPSETATVSKNPGGLDDATIAGYTNDVGVVTNVAYGAITVSMYPSSVSVADYTSFGSLGIGTDSMTSQRQISPAASTPVYMYSNGAWVSRSLNDISTGDVLIITYDNGAATGNPIWIVIASKGQSSAGGNQNKPGISSGASASASATAAETQEPEDIYAISDTTVMSLTPADKMSVSITIDELDILKMKKGQEATVTLDAISGETFAGTVTDIGLTGANSGGSTKFTAVVTLDRTEQMLAGMNAAVTITISSADCAVTVPVAALNESESGTFVYTAYDEEKRELGGPTAVTTGVSDGTSVEILSGLNEGDEIWYEYDDKVSITSSVVSSSGSGGFNLMSLFGGRRGRQS